MPSPLMEPTIAACREGWRAGLGLTGGYPSNPRQILAELPISAATGRCAARVGTGGDRSHGGDRALSAFAWITSHPRILGAAARA